LPPRSLLVAGAVVAFAGGAWTALSPQDAGLSLLSQERQMADSRSQLPADSPLRVASPLRRLPDPDDRSTWSRQALDSQEAPARP